MPSDLQRVARGLVECLDEVPGVLHHLQRTAVRCRENAAVAAQGGATVAAHQLDAAARACEAAAHYLSMAPPKARLWADRLVGGGSGTDRLSSDSADRNRATGGKGDVVERDTRGRTKRLTATFEDVEVADDNEPPLITVARKAFEKFRKDHEKDDEQNPNPDEPLEVEIVVTETGEFEIEEKTEKEEKEEEKRNERLLADHEFLVDLEEEVDEFLVDLEEEVKNLLEAMAESADQSWDHATFTITPTTIEATFDYPDNDKPHPIVVDINLPPLRHDGSSKAAASFKEYRERLAGSGRTRPLVGDGPEADFQRKHCGPLEYRLTSDEDLPRASWADGLDDLLKRAQDAKYVAPSSERSFYRPESLPPFLRKIAEEKNDHQLLKYRAVIGDVDNPVEGLEIITNDATAAAYFRERMRLLDIPGQVTVRREDDD